MPLAQFVEHSQIRKKKQIHWRSGLNLGRGQLSKVMPLPRALFPVNCLLSIKANMFRLVRMWFCWSNPEATFMLIVKHSQQYLLFCIHVVWDSGQRQKTPKSSSGFRAVNENSWRICCNECWLLIEWIWSVFLCQSLGYYSHNISHNTFELHRTPCLWLFNRVFHLVQIQFRCLLRFLYVVFIDTISLYWEHKTNVSYICDCGCCVSVVPCVY